MRIRLIGVIALLLFCSSCDEMSSADGGGDFVIFGEDNVENTNPPERVATKKVESIQMRKEGGVYLIPTKVNGIPMEFIIDTGASMVSISTTEALFLYKNGLLTDSDRIGTKNFVLANGAVEEGVVVKLKSIQIGNRVVYDVEATIDGNISAPLLLGQSILERFGKVSMDYSTGIMELEY